MLACAHPLRVHDGAETPSTINLKQVSTIAEMRNKAAEALEYLDNHASRMSPVKRPMEPGHYRDVPKYMLATPGRAAFLGPRVSKKLVDESSSYHRKQIEEGSRPVY